MHWPGKTSLFDAVCMTPCLISAPVYVSSCKTCLQGLWTACYGGHRPEMLHVCFEDSLQPHQPASPSNDLDYMPRPRLVACKVTGDPNVPANETSFRAQVILSRFTIDLHLHSV